jgi:hypothetical protein
LLAGLTLAFGGTSRAATADEPVCSCSGNGVSWPDPWLPCSPCCEGEDDPGLPPEELGDEGEDEGEEGEDDGDEGEDEGEEDGEDEGDDGGCGIEVDGPSILQPASTTRPARGPSIQNLVRVFMT